jgi:multisubunit Na+/H+ antiporter MnhG subunit
MKRRRVYFALMGTCLALIVLAWFVVRLWSVPAAIAMSVVAMAIPPTAAVIANTASTKAVNQADWGREPP